MNAHTRSCRPWVVMTGCATASSHKALSSRAELVAPVPVHVMRLLRRCQTHMRECTVPGQQARPHVMPSSRPAGQRRPPLPPPAGERWPVALAADPPGHATHKTNTHCAHAPVRDTCSSYTRHAVRWRSHHESHARLFRARVAQSPPHAAATRHMVAVGVDGGLLQGTKRADQLARRSQMRWSARRRCSWREGKAHAEGALGL